MKGATDQEIPHLTATEVVDQRVPIRVVALARILVLVECTAIETGEAMRVSGEMRRHPVEQHTQSHRMGSRHEATQRCRVAMTRGRCIKTDGLVSPRAVERMLGHRQEFEVREPEVGDVGQQRVGQFVPGQERLRGVIVPAPRSRVHFVDAQRRAVHGGARRAGYGAASGAALHRCRDDARRRRAQFDLLRVGIHLLRQY